MQSAVTDEEVGQRGVEGFPVLGRQGAQRAQRRGVRPVHQPLAGLPGAGGDALEGGVDGGEPGLRARRVLTTTRVTQDDSRQSGGELAAGGSLRRFGELLPGEVEGLAVPGDPVPQEHQAERAETAPLT